MAALGLALLWRAVGRRDVPLSTRTFVGSLALGWGLFVYAIGRRLFWARTHPYPDTAPRA